MHPALFTTALALGAFACNSLLARAALSGHAIDAASFTAIRLASGAAALAGLLWLRQGRRGMPALAGNRPSALAGNWPSAICLFGYALGFSWAYLRLGAATGALILFGAVQATMIAWGVIARDRPAGLELAGLAVAFAAFLYLLLPGLAAPDPLGSLSMVGAGVAWGAYSVRGRATADALGDTAGNFVRAGLICVPLLPFAVMGHIEASGVGLALVSGVVTSGLGYAVWYRALPRLSTIQAGVVQLLVPVLASFGAVVLLGETLTWRLALCSLFVLGGVAVALLARSRRMSVG